jgi:hypothetical protein
MTWPRRQADVGQSGIAMPFEDHAMCCRITLNEKRRVYPRGNTLGHRKNELLPGRMRLEERSNFVPCPPLREKLCWIHQPNQN